MRGFPAREGVHERLSGEVVPAAELAGQRTDRAAAHRVLPRPVGHDRVEPAVDACQRVDLQEQRFLHGQHCVHCGMNHGADEVVPVVEVVVELTAADRRGVFDIVQCHRRDAAALDEVRGRIEDALSCRATPRGGRCVSDGAASVSRTP